MKNILIIMLLLMNMAKGRAAVEKDSLFIRLNKVMDNKEYYIMNKEHDIQNLKQMFALSSLSPRQQYEINLKLYKEYVKYQSDSAVHYVLKNKEITRLLGEEELQYETTIHLAGLYSTKGMYIESKEMLDRIDKDLLPRRLLPVYYETYNEFYSHYGQSNDNDFYYHKSSEYRDSMLLVLEPQSMQYRIADAARKLFANEDVEKILLDLLQQTTDQDSERALIAFLLGTHYKNINNAEFQKKYFAISAITDVINCIKDNASLNSLALTYYALGDMDNAYRFFQAAMDDAVFCNVRYRASEASKSYPIINENYHAKEKAQKGHLQLFLIFISVLLIILAFGLIYIYLQMKQLSHIRKELDNTNHKLSEQNNDLKTANDQLRESNIVKEEYIAHFFDLCSTYIDKMENFRKTMHKYASNHQTNELSQMLRSKDLIDTELEELYHKFDVIFLSLYPSFVEEFRALQLSGKPVALKAGELLNTELRIFALIRLGITDSVKIAGFLRYSISTIYNYRVQARNNATVPRDEFEQKVMKIGNYMRNS